MDAKTLLQRDDLEEIYRRVLIQAQYDEPEVMIGLGEYQGVDTILFSVLPESTHTFPTSIDVDGELVPVHVTRDWTDASAYDW